MHLKSLTLKGFKSFAQPTTFAFEPGVTCIVGPNGSGKSNVVDALAWVMGEQGVKTLRGGKMEDVIFAGTSTRGPLGRAEVTLTIDNADGALPIEYSEVTISRTLFRNGGSEYAINGKQCRLLDVQELLSDSGLGREMHVIVGQGQLDAVLHASPDDRRGFIEEAAGILKHRRRKEKTLRKLEAMQTNLTRLSDLAGEIRRQLKPLGAQAEVAREAQTIAAVVRDAKARLLADNVVGLRAALDDFSKDETQRHSERIVLQEQLEQKQLRIARIEQEQVGDAVDGARRTAFALESVQERLRSLFTLANQRLALLGSQAQLSESARTVTPDMIEASKAEAAQLREGVGDADAAVTTAQAATRSARARLDSVDEQIAAQSALVSQHDLELTKLAGQGDAAAQRLAAVRGELLRQQNQLEAAEQRRTAAEEALADSAGDSPLGPDAQTELAEAYELAQASVFESEAEIERLRDELRTLERERDALSGQAKALGRALEARDGSAALIAAGRSGVHGRVADLIKVEPGFEAAIAAVLGTLADAVIVADRDAAVAAARYASHEDLGSIELVIEGRQASSALVAIANKPRNARVAEELLIDATPSIRELLRHVLVVDDLDQAHELWPSFAGGDSVLVTRAGEVLSKYTLRGGSGTGAGRIELLAERDAAAERLTELETAIGVAKAEHDARREALQAAKQQSSAALTQLRSYDAQLAEQSEKTSRLTAQLEAANAEAERIERGIVESRAKVEEAEQAASAAKRAHETHASKPRPILDVSERDAVSGELDACREVEVQARLAAETARERVRAEESRTASLLKRQETERAAAAETARREVIRRHQVEAAESVIAALPRVLDSVDRSVSQARTELSAAEAARAEQNEEIVALRRDEATLRDRLQAVSESVHGLELQIYEKKLHLSGLLERAGNELGLVEDVLVAEYGPEVMLPAEVEDGEGRPFVRAEQEKRLQDAERKMSRLGRVNPLALEEFAALEQRHKFLTEQLTDLTNTRKDLLTIIADIDERMQGIFADAFEDTRRTFAEVFPVLFPGGSGSIMLTDPDDLLTTGIEVSVRPAGKKIERLSLLSGGERSLAAVAFLMAIFKARPSPFYIMDEVEAALDDANLGRLLTTFEDLRADSQLIVITHQKRTMEIADALYGVSMRQDGVSAVVGQRVADRDADTRASREVVGAPAGGSAERASA
ncbi:chromosome segregation protein SMC [Humibacter ginsenosidimutans]|uniref:Chromosome partition protein Smc n=1 Tax=Humibacter ginsenosidimutans TaxID=2599293 RepID=A0A5B8M219_9MICO|nr:chromosome segregation protein SMC [Humibacter ginsenosidimutans]QDZ14101.1 chromosome segregation protein SMC [Humibacter ginsenosidimutans]